MQHTGNYGHAVTRVKTHLHGLHYVKVGHIFVSELRVLGQMHIFLSHHHALFEEELIDGNAILLGHQHLDKQKVWGWLEFRQGEKKKKSDTLQNLLITASI